MFVRLLLRPPALSILDWLLGLLSAPIWELPAASAVLEVEARKPVPAAFASVGSIFLTLSLGTILIGPFVPSLSGGLPGSAPRSWIFFLEAPAPGV